MIDSFLVDFNYLARNTQINAIGAGMAAIGPKTPTFTADVSGNNVAVTLTSQTQYPYYRIGVRSSTFDFDSVYTIAGTTGNIYLALPDVYYFSVASSDTNEVESLFGGEQMVQVTSAGDLSAASGIFLLPSKPNPADELTVITVLVKGNPLSSNVVIRIFDSNGSSVREIPLSLKPGLNDVSYHHGYNVSGIFFCELELDGKVIDRKKMVFAR